MRIARLALLFLLFPCVASAADIFISQSGGGAGTSCASPRALSSLVAGDWVAGNRIRVCGTITSVLTAQGNGSSGNPITIQGESGSTFSAPVWSFSTGAINLQGHSFITVTGVTIQNTNNTTASGAVTTNGINANSCTNCIITNSTIINMLVRAQFDPATPNDKSLYNAIQLSGSNNTISNNIIHDCGWCIRQFYVNGDTNNTISGNEIYNFGHGVTLANSTASGAQVYSGLFMFGNKLHDTANWDGPVGNCFEHHDGLHAFGSTNAGQTMTEVYLHDNLFYGNWGQCPTAFVFIEGGTSTNRSNMINYYEFNDVGLVPAGGVEVAGVGSNGWFTVFSGTGKVIFVNNTVIGPSAAANSKGINIGCTLVSAGDCLKNPTIENNVEVGFGSKVDYNPTGTMLIDYNGYDPFCNFGNCWVWKGLFKNPFSNWQTTLQSAGVSGFDFHGINTNLGLNSNGTVTSATSAVVNAGTNLATLANSNSNLAGLLLTTSAGGTAVQQPRPTVGNWTMGAYQFSSGVTPPNPPSGLTATASGASTINLNWTLPSGSFTGENVYRGTVHNGPYTLIRTGLTGTTFSDTGLAANTYFYTVTAFNGFTVSSISGSGSVATVTCSAACPVPVSSSINIGGNTVSQFNGTFTTTSQPTSTTFTFASSTGGTGTGGSAWISGAESARSNEATAAVPATATVSVSPSSLTYAARTVGTTSPSQTVTLTNTSGPGINVTVSSVGIIGTNAGDFAQTNNCTTVASGSSCGIFPTFTPTAAGTRTATLQIFDNATGSPHTVALSGTGVAATPIANLTPSSHDFGSQTVSTTSTAFAFTLTNSGTGTLTVSSITPSGDFAVLSTVPATLCGTNIPPGNSCLINATFTPTVTGGRTGSISVADNAAGTPHVSTLSGTGITTKCQFSNQVSLTGVATVCQ